MSAPIYVMRHGQTEWNAIERVQGQAEADLTALGRSQAAANGRMLKSLIPDASAYRFIASPLRRTRETMEIVRGEMGLPREGYELEPRIVEVHFGDWQGFTLDELEAARPGMTKGRDAQKWTFLPPGTGAESYALLAERIRPWVAEMQGPAVVVTHGGIVRALFNILNGLSGQEASMMPVHQDRVLRWQHGRIGWL